MDLTRSYKKEIAPESRAFLNDEFSWMGLGLALTAVVSYFVATTPSIMEMFFTETGPSMLGYIVTFAPIGFVLVMSFAFQKLSYGTLVLLFALYAGLMGLSLSFIFMVYTSESIYSTFGISAGMFGAMGLVGYLTKTDLTKMGNILLMALIGVIIAGVVNMFMHSSVMGYIISFVSVLIFCGLTAYDVQKIKNLSEDHSIDAYNKSKLRIMGALTLYLDFINLFLAMLRLFGNRK